MEIAAATPGTTPSAPPPAAMLAARLTPVILALLALVRARVGILGDTTAPLWNRISRIRQRLSRLLDAIAQGRPPRTRKPTPTKPRSDPPKRERVKLPHPRQHGWLVAKLGWEAAAYTSQLQHVLMDPEAQAALADAIAHSPGIARNLRPLCRLLGVPLPPCLHLPPRPPRPLPQRKPKPKQPRSQGLLPTDRPLPAYVRAAVRVWKPRKIRTA
jgi:hypothetical protein